MPPPSAARLAQFQRSETTLICAVRRTPMFGRTDPFSTRDLSTYSLPPTRCVRLPPNNQPMPRNRFDVLGSQGLDDSATRARVSTLYLVWARVIGRRLCQTFRIVRLAISSANGQLPGEARPRIWHLADVILVARKLSFRMFGQLDRSCRNDCFRRNEAFAFAFAFALPTPTDRNPPNCPVHGRGLRLPQYVESGPSAWEPKFKFLPKRS